MDDSGASRLASVPIVLINLEHRTDRLRDSMTELASWIGRIPDQNFHVLQPRLFTDAGGFINAAYRSCLDSHLRAAQRALDQGWGEVLVLEDDIECTSGWIAHGNELLQSLDDQSWDIAAVGYLDPESWLDDHLDPERQAPYWVENSGGVIGAHAYLVKASMLPRWIAHLTKISTGQPGDEVTGPMGPDGAMATITWADPSVRRIIPIPNLVGQRPSLSDINARRIDSIGVLAQPLSAARMLKRKFRRRLNGQNVSSR